MLAALSRHAWKQGAPGRELSSACGEGWVSYAERMGVTTQGRHQTERDLKSWDVPLEGGR